MTSVPQQIYHLLLVPIPAWGHVRPFLVFATRLVLEREDIVVTILLASTEITKAHTEISNQFQPGHADTTARERIRLISTINSADTDALSTAMSFTAAYASAYEALIQSKPIACVTTGTVSEPLPPPVAIVMDLTAWGPLQATRAMTGRSIPLIGFIPMSAATILHLAGLGTEGLGGPEFREKIDAEVKRTGRPIFEVSGEILGITDDSIVKIPGLPPMYAHELFPQSHPLEHLTVPFLAAGHLFFRDCEAIIVHASDAYDSSGSLAALSSRLGLEGRSVYSIGPLLPLGYGVDDLSASRGDKDVETFLETMLKKRGERSVTFISFGTIFWPSIPGYLEEVIEAFIEKETPFILCHASPMSTLSNELREKINHSGLAYISVWTPQHYVLNHPATGWFLTHGGQGSITESLGSGIPMICWPFMADQPLSAAHLTNNLNVAIELIEVRTGASGMQPVLRYNRAPKGTREAVGTEIRGVLEACKGDKGKELRRNAERLKEEFADSWKDGGHGRTEVRAFLDKFVQPR